MSKIKFTGKFKHSRKYLKMLAEKYGRDLINKQDYLVYGENCGSILLKAQNSHMIIFNEDQFLLLIRLAVSMRGVYE